jgi:hypothetical protein
MASFKMDLDLPGWRKIIGTPAHGITKQSSQLLAFGGKAGGGDKQKV